MQLLCNHPPAISSSPAVTPCLWWESRVSRTDHDVLNHVDSMGTPLEEAPAPVPSPPSLPHMSEVNGEILVIDFISLNRGGLLKFVRLLVLCCVLLVKWTQSLCSWESSSPRKSPANPHHPPSLPSTHPPILHYTHNYIFTSTQHARSHACAHTAFSLQVSRISRFDVFSTRSIIYNKKWRYYYPLVIVLLSWSLNRRSAR